MAPSCFRRIMLCALAAALLAASTSAQSSPDLCSWSNFRLPRNVIPSHYDLDLTVDLVDVTVVGSVGIVVEQKEAAQCIVMHAEESMDTGDIVAMTEDGQEFVGTPSLPDPPQDGMIIVDFGETVPAGELYLTTDFNFTISDGLLGFYQARYENEAGEEKLIATTQFQTTHARKGFPCFDEPNLKATFNTTVTAREGLTAITNGAEVSAEEVDDGWIKHTFEQTPIMPTYLIAFVIGEMDYVEGEYERDDGSTVDIRCYSTPQNSDKLEFALNNTISALDGYEKFFKVRYPFSKLDTAGVPDFDAGAMENYGLILYREVALLLSPDPIEQSITSLKAVPYYVAHEVSHMWVGDLVTTQWWNELWLNEGFATYFENMGSNFYWNREQPKSVGRWNYYDFFYVDFVNSALVYDSELDTYPLSSRPVSVSSEDQAESIFNAIAYDKGGSVVRMLRSYMRREELESVTDTAIDEDFYLRRLASAAVKQGAAVPRKLLAFTEESVMEDYENNDDLFIRGMAYYFDKYKFGDVTGEKLWSTLSEFTGLPIQVWMDTWAYQAGSPVVTVEDDGDGVITISQMKLTRVNYGSYELNCSADPEVLIWDAEDALSENNSTDDELMDRPWWIPIAYTLGDTDEVYWTVLHECEDTLNITVPEDTWIKLNIGQYGLYRVNYDNELWERLIEAAPVAERDALDYIPEIDLAGLMHDSYYLAEAGAINITIFLRFTEAMVPRAESEEIMLNAWDPIDDHMTTFYNNVDDEECRDLFVAYVADELIGSFVSTRGIDLYNVSLDDPAEYRELRYLLLSMSATFATESAAVEAEEAVLAYLDGEEVIHADLRQAQFTLAVKAGNQTTYDALVQYYNTATDSSEQRRVLAAIASPPEDEEAITAALDFALTSALRYQDTPSYIASVAASSPLARNITFNYLIDNEEAFFDKVGGTPGDKAREQAALIASVASLSTNLDATDAVGSYLKTLFPDSNQDEAVLTDIVNSIESRATIVDDLLPPVCEWLSTRADAGQVATP